MHIKRNTKPRLGCIADDFTGASDLASFLLKGGLSVTQINGLPDETDLVTQEADALVIALKTRTCAVDQAIRESLNSLRWLQQQGCERFYFKYCSTFDSSAEGNIGPVIDALMAVLDCEHTLVCPALPVNGRTVYCGNLFVNQQPLAESSMAHHPLTPMRDSNVLRLLDEQVAVQYRGQCSNIDWHSLQTSGQAPLSASGRYWVADSLCNEDLKILAGQFATRDNFPLLTGGSGLGEFIGAAYKQAGWLTEKTAPATLPKVPGAALVLAGSCSQATLEQVGQAKTQLPSYQISALALANKQQSCADAVKFLEQHRGQSVIVYSSAGADEVKLVQQQLGEAQSSALIEDCMAQLAFDAVKLNYYQKIVVAGGETSGAIVSCLQLKQLQVGSSICPGVPLLYKVVDENTPNGLMLALKSGNFGDKNFFLDAIARMQ